MSERNHSTPEQAAQTFSTEGAPNPVPTPKSRATARGGKLFWILGGAVTAVALIAIGFQLLRQNEAVAETAEDAAARQAQEAHIAKLRQRPLARVGKQVINYDAVANECFIRYGDEVMETMVNRLIIQQACEERGIEITATRVDAEVLKIAKKFNLTPDNWYAMLHSERGLTPDQYRRDVIWPMLALKALAGNDVDVTKDDLAKAFESAYGPRVEAKMIMLDNFRHAESVWAEAKKKPEDFERLAQEHSIEPNSRALGGTVPPIRKHSGNSEIVKRAFSMKPGEVSPVIQVAPGRFVILKCEGFTDPVVKEMTPEVQQELYTSLIEEKTQVAVAKVFEQLKKEIRVDNYLTDVTTGGHVQQVSGQQEPTGTASVRQATQQTPAGR